VTESTNEIISLCIKGNKEAFRRLVEKYQPYAYALALRLLCHEEDAKDVVQDCFIRVWYHLQKFNPKYQFTTWLYKIVTNLCYDRIKMAKRRKKVFSYGLENENLLKITNELNMENEIDNKELTKTIEIFSHDLTPKQRMVFVLRDLQDLSIKEVAKILGISMNAVKSNLSLARQMIRKKLEITGIHGGVSY